jgi:localization factor PodJL
LLAKQQAPHGAKPRSTGLVRLAMAAMALIAVGLWAVQQRSDGAAAVEPAAPAIAATDSEAAFAYLLREAYGGAPLAQYQLAKRYEHGDGAAPDLMRAREWAERAADGGNVRAMHDMGVFYARGEGGVGGDAGALRWFAQAAEFGMVDSQFNLGVFYEQGRVVAADPAEALFWFSLAARGGDVSAAARGVALEASLTPMEVERVRLRVEAFTPRASDPAANGAP